MARRRHVRPGARRDRTLWPVKVDSQWGGARPILSPADSLAAAKKLWRHAVGSSWKGKWKLTSGRRKSQIIGNVFYVNPDEPGERGLRELIHSISHAAHYRLHPNEAPHSINQVRLEARLTKFAIAHGWHLPKPEPEPVEAPPPAPKPSLKERRAAKRAAALERALHRLKLAQAAVDRLSGKAKPRKRRRRAKPLPSLRSRLASASRKLNALARLYPEAFEIERARYPGDPGPGQLVIWPHEWLADDDDPANGDHYAGDSIEALDMAEKYVALWQARQQEKAA